VVSVDHGDHHEEGVEDVEGVEDEDDDDDDDDDDDEKNNGSYTHSRSSVCDIEWGSNLPDPFPTST
jgi:hypothetical protein